MPKARGRGSRIHAGLVGRRELVGTTYLNDPELRREYAAQIAPRTRAALAKALPEIFLPDILGAREGAPGARAVRVLDLGAGTGAAGEAARAFFGASTEVVSVDRVPGPGIVAADLAAPGPVRGVTGRFDVVIAAHLVNEIFTHLSGAPRIAARSSKILAWCQSLLAPAGTFIILEPALRETSRELLAVRDQLLIGGLGVVAPCFWQGPCPALARERDWCHDAVDAVALGAANREGPARVDFSYLALRPHAPPAADRALYRIVSDALIEKGRLRFFGCGPDGRHPLVRLDRHRTPANQAFDDLARGDVARVTGTLEANDGRRIVPETAVEIVVDAASGQREPAG